MQLIEPSVSTSEIPTLIEELKQFLGPMRTDEAIAKHRKNSVHHGPIATEYFHNRRHPWLHALSQREDCIRHGLAISNDLQQRLAQIAADYRTIRTVFETATISESTVETYRTNLLDVENARAYLFEIETAMHFLRMNTIAAAVRSHLASRGKTRFHRCRKCSLTLAVDTELRR